MALKQLTTGEMLSLSEPWVSPGPVRALLDGIAEARPVLPHVEAARRALLDTQFDPTQPELQKLSEQAGALDARHDAQVGGIHALLGALAQLATDPARGEALLRLRDRLFPQGVSVVQHSYRDEAGQAELVEGRLTEADRALLRAVPVLSSTLGDVVARWQHTARELGRVEDRRVALLDEKRRGTRPADVVAARNQWIRAVNALLSALDLAAPDERTRLAILGALEASTKAAARRRQSTQSVQATTSTEPQAAAASGGDPDPAA